MARLDVTERVLEGWGYIVGKRKTDPDTPRETPKEKTLGGSSAGRNKEDEL